MKNKDIDEVEEVGLKNKQLSDREMKEVDFISAYSSAIGVLEREVNKFCVLAEIDSYRCEDYSPVKKEMSFLKGRIDRLISLIESKGKMFEKVARKNAFVKGGLYDSVIESISCPKMKGSTGRIVSIYGQISLGAESYNIGDMVRLRNSCKNLVQLINANQDFIYGKLGSSDPAKQARHKFYKDYGSKCNLDDSEDIKDKYFKKFGYTSKFGFITMKEDSEKSTEKTEHSELQDFKFPEFGEDE